MVNVSQSELTPLFSYKKPYIYFKNRQLPSTTYIVEVWNLYHSRFQSEHSTIPSSTLYLGPLTEQYNLCVQNFFKE